MTKYKVKYIDGFWYAGGLVHTKSETWNEARVHSLTMEGHDLLAKLETIQEKLAYIDPEEYGEYAKDPQAWRA